MGDHLKLSLAVITPLLALNACQLPSSLSRDPLPLKSTNVTGMVRMTAGLPEPTWDSLVPKGRPSSIPGWDREIDATYFSIETSEKVIAITFDDGPHGVNTPRLLDMLKKRGVKATFFVVGTNVKLYPEIIRRIVAEDHEIANHTVTHGNLAKMSDSALRKELTAARDAIVAATGVTPRMMRPPYGAITNNQKKLMLKEFGYPTILWSVDPEDWKRPGASVVTSRLVNGARPGGILLVHDLHAPTVDAMPSTLDQLLDKGYRFVTITELIMMDESYEEKSE